MHKAKGDVLQSSHTMPGPRYTNMGHLETCRTSAWLEHPREQQDVRLEMWVETKIYWDMGTLFCRNRHLVHEGSRTGRAEIGGQDTLSKVRLTAAACCLQNARNRRHLKVSGSVCPKVESRNTGFLCYSAGERALQASHSHTAVPPHLEQCQAHSRRSIKNG